ncbi:MAG: endonuclease domain-containing protein [Balneolaceae bacterium]
MRKKKYDIIPYRPVLVERARRLRLNSTPAEIELWKYLRKKQIHGVDFDRQKPIDWFIVDFYCKELKIAIEIDGHSHNFKVEYDRKRQTVLESFGIRVLRFSEKEVFKELDNVLSEIEYWVSELK